MAALNFDVDDNGSEGMGVEIYCNKDDGDFIGIHLYSDTGSGICHFEGNDIDKLLAAFETIKKELRPLGIKEPTGQQTTAPCCSVEDSHIPEAGTSA
jgi:hypothetical protein